MDKQIDVTKMRKDCSVIRISYRFISERISKLLVHTPITPNQITVISIFFGLFGGLFFALGEWKYLLIGVLFLQLAEIFDFVDGEIARYKGMVTNFGKWFDPIAGEIVIFLLFFGATIGVYRMTNDSIIPFIGILAIFNIVFIKGITGLKEFLPFIKGHKEIKIGEKGFVSMGTTVLLLLSLSALINQVKWCLWVIALGGILVWIKQIITHYKLARVYDKNVNKNI